MAIKKQKTYSVMTVALGVICCSYAQAGSKSTEARKFPLPNTKQSSGQLKNSLPKVSTALAKPTVEKKPLLVPVKSPDEQANKKRELEDLKKFLEAPGQKASLELLLTRTTEEAKHCSTVNPDAVEKMFSPGTKLNLVEGEGAKYFDSKEQFLDAAAKQINDRGEFREADILNTRGWLVKKNKKPTDIDALLKRQRADRTSVVFYMLDKELQGFDSRDIENLTKGADKSDEFIKTRQRINKMLEDNFEKIEKEDKNFDKDKQLRSLLNITPKNNGKMIVFLTNQLKEPKKKGYFS